MLYTIHFHGNADADADPDICPRCIQKNLSFLCENTAVICAAGLLKETVGAVESGLWLVHVETVDQAWEFVKADPFWPTGLRDTIEVKQWVQVLTDEQARV
jgi:uncharacterized protein